MAAKDNRSQERRRYERFDIQLPVEAVFSGNGMERVIRSRSLNICAGGAFFPSAVEFTPGTRLSLKIEAPSGSLSYLFSNSSVDSADPVHIKTECEIVRSEQNSGSSDEFGLGVMFSGPMRIAPKALGKDHSSETETASLKNESSEGDLPPSERSGGASEAMSEGIRGVAGEYPVFRDQPTPSDSNLHTDFLEDKENV